MTKARPIFFEAQEDSRKCGAAALSMVYRAFGQPVRQGELWPRISDDKWSARTHLLAKDALSRGFSAMVVQARDPRRILDRCTRSSIPAILNHRLHPASRQGHYSVFLNRSRRGNLLHDPFHGPARVLSDKQLSDLWTWEIGGREVAGNVLVALAPNRDEPSPCPACRQPIPQDLPCPACGEKIPIPFADLLGCGDVKCPERAWLRLFCPHCDHHVSSFNDEPETNAVVEQPSLLNFLIDIVEERVNMAGELATDPKMQEQLRAISANIGATRGQLESEIKGLADRMKAAQQRADGADDAKENAAKDAKTRQQLRRQRVADRKAKKQANLTVAAVDLVEPAAADSVDGDQLRSELFELGN